MNTSKNLLLLFLVIILAFAFHLPALLHSQSFWFDEIVSLKIAEKNIVESWQYLQWENNPPLHYWFLHFWVKIFGEEELALRLSSLLFFIFDLMLFYLLGRRLTGRHAAGLFSSFLAAASSYYLFTSMDARMYPMLLFFSLLSFYFFWQWLATGKKRLCFFYIVAAVLALYTHLTALFVILITSAYWFYHHFYLNKKQPSWISWLLANIIVILFFLPWLWRFTVHNLARLNGAAWYFHTTAAGFFLFEIPRAFFFLGLETQFLEFFGLIIFGLILAVVFIKNIRWSLADKEIKLNFKLLPPAVFAFLIFIIPLALGFILQVWVTKYYIIGSAGLFLLLGIGFSDLKIKPVFKKALIAAVFILLLPNSAFIIKTQGQYQWEKVARYVVEEEKSGDILLFPASVYELLFRYYYTGKLSTSPVLAKGLEDDLLLRAIKYNWSPIVRAMSDLGPAFSAHNRVIAVYPATTANIHNVDLVLDWFLKERWPLVAEKQFGGFENATVYIFKNPDR